MFNSSAALHSNLWPALSVDNRCLSTCSGTPQQARLLQLVMMEACRCFVISVHDELTESRKVYDKRVVVLGQNHMQVTTRPLVA